MVAMRRSRTRSRSGGVVGVVVSLAVLALPAAGSAGAAAHGRGPNPAPPAEEFTPVTVNPLGEHPEPVLGSDGRYHVLYELELTNTKPAPATLQQVQVVVAGSGGRVLVSYSGQALLGELRTLVPQPATTLVIPENESRLLYVQLSFPTLTAVPRAVTQRLQLLAAGDPAATTASPLSYTAGRVAISKNALPVLGPPLAGKNWIAVNGCCNANITHRGAYQSINGSLYDAQRFAIDWMRINARGELEHGNPAVLSSYVDYGARVLAVAGGTVVSTIDDLMTGTPGSLPNPASFLTVADVGGNSVVLDLGHGIYALYAHMKKGSVTVHPGQHVTRGEVLGRLGDTGNAAAPHLHFQLMDGPTDLGAQGLPYVFGDFATAGKLQRDPATATSFAGTWVTTPLPRATTQHDRFPLNLDVVSFPAG